MDYKTEYSWSSLFKDYWAILEGKRFRFVFFTILRSLTSLIPFLTAYILGMIIDFFVNYSVGDSLKQFYIFVIIIGLASVLQVWLRFFAKNYLQTIGAELRAEVKVAAMKKIMNLDLSWHEKEETGSKITKIHSGVGNIYKAIQLFSNHGIGIPTSLIGALIIFLSLNWVYALYSISFLIIYFLGEYYFNKRVSYWITEWSKIVEKVSGKFHESASNLLTVKSMGLNNIFEKTTSDYEKKAFDVWRKTKDINHLKAKTIKIFSALVYAGFILILGHHIVSGVITVGLIYTFLNYFGNLRKAADEYTNNINKFIEVKTSIGRFMTIFGIEIIDKDKDKKTIPKNWKKIEFNNVYFKYKDKYVLKNFNLQVKRNEKIGIVGRSGCGKSSLVKLFLGLYPLEKGSIKIDNFDIDNFKHKSITDEISVVLQDSEMFNSSIFENITISSLRKNKLLFEEAIKISQLKELIRKFPNGINTLLGERGYKVSGGERQRIGIARAIYKNSPIMILDEATSSLDSKTESKIQIALEKGFKKKTLLIIAHRLSTLRNVDRIVFMEQGKIVEKGTFNELINKKGKFYKMYNLQKNK